MNKQLLFSSLAAAALLSGCRVYMPGESPRRTVFGSTPAASSRAADEVPPARVGGTRAAAAAPAGDVVAPRPVAAAPAPAPAPDPVPLAVPASAAPTAGADSYRNYIGGGAAAAAPRRVAPAAPVAAPAAPAPRAPTPVVAEDGYRIYTVKAGDSAGMIANSNGMTLAEFVKLNNLADPDKLRVGQTVKLAAGRPASAPGSAARPVAPVAPVEPAQNAVHPIPETPAATPVASVPTPTTRPPRRTRPVRVTPDEASAAPGSTVTAGDATIDVDAALSGSGLGAARQRARETVQDAAGQVRDAAQAAGDQAQSALGQVSDAAGRAADAVSSAAAGTKEYVVQDGDDIYSIAMQFDSQPLKIRSLNGGKSLDDLVPGDRILVPAK